MYEYQITVQRYKSCDGEMFYTAWYRKVYFLFRGKWRILIPMYVSSIDDAEDLIEKHKFFS